MKTIFLLRHAKSCWADDTLKDHDRPLKKRGKSDALAMAAHVASHHSRPENVLCSNAQRTQETLTYFQDSWNLKKKSIEIDSGLYLATEKELLKILSTLPKECSSVLVLGHNPGMTDLINTLVPSKDYLSNLPTCGFVELRVDTDDWGDVKTSGAELKQFHRPKDL